MVHVQRNASASTLTCSPPWQLSGLPKQTPVLLALSGGADSRALLHLLAQQAKQDGFPLTVAHINHCIRGEEAERDADFCHRLANEYGLKLAYLREDVPALAAEHGRSLEEEAREVRYAFFAKLMEERSIPLLATAHHADDNLETVLFRLSRGSTLKGACGILPCRPFGKGFVVRPLLNATAEEIRTYCAKNSLEYVTDSTNELLCCARNRIRMEVIPVLEQLFPNPQKRVAQFAKYAKEDEDYLTEQAQRFLSEQPAKGLPMKELQSLPDAILRRVLRMYAKEHLDRELESKHTELLMQWVRTQQGSTERALYDGCLAVVENGSLRMVRGTSHLADLQSAVWQLQLGKTTLPCANIEVFTKKIEKNTKVHKLSTAPYIIIKGASAIIINSLYWRLRKQGDEIYFHGMHRKLRRLYNEKKIPPRIRQQLPLLCDDKGILWAPFVGMRDDVSFDGEDDYMVELLLPQDLWPMTEALTEDNPNN